MSGVAEYVPPSAIDRISNPSSCLIQVCSVRVRRPRSRQLEKFLSQIDKDILSVAAMLFFLDLVQHTHALAHTHTQLPKHQTYDPNSQSKMFSLSSELIKYDDGVFRWAESRGALRTISIYPLSRLWSGMSVNVVNGNYRVTRKIRGK